MISTWFKYVVIGLFGIAFLSLIADLTRPNSNSPLPLESQNNVGVRSPSDVQHTEHGFSSGGSSWLSFGMGALSGYLWGSRPSAVSVPAVDTRVSSQNSPNSSQVSKQRKSSMPTAAKNFVPTRKNFRSVRNGGFGRRTSKPARVRSFRRR